MPLRSCFRTHNLHRKLLHAARVMGPTLVAFAFAGNSALRSSSLRSCSALVLRHPLLVLGFALCCLLLRLLFGERVP
jgi:hypothetical protein